MGKLQKMKKPSRQNLSNWLYGAECFLADLTDQGVIPGFENDDKLKQSKINSEEAQRILHGLCEALAMDWPPFVNALSRAWMRRRKQKCKRLDWYPEEERLALLTVARENEEAKNF